MGSLRSRLPIIIIFAQTLVETRMVERSAQSIRNRLWRYGPLLIWMAFIFAFSTSGLSATHTSRFVRPILLWLSPDISEERIAVVHIIVRKISHFSSYAVLGLLAARAFLGSAVRTLSEHWFAAGVLLVIGYALLDEYHQSFVPSRSASIFDSLIDIAGGLFALICVSKFRRRFRP